VVPSILDQGRFSGYSWKVTVNNDERRRGVCMLAAILRPSGAGPGENASCSAPALRRGNIRTLFAHKPGGGVALTVFGGAFDPRIEKVEAVMLDGKVRNLPFRTPRGGGSRDLSRFRYTALAVHGPWCLAELVTRNGHGAAMWRASADEILAYSPAFQCMRH
jgi:hypothetical protein